MPWRGENRLGAACLTEERFLLKLPGDAAAAPATHVPVDAEMRIFGQALRVRILATRGPARTADMVPLARDLANELVRMAADNVRLGGMAPSCHKGCSACCRYLVPLSAPEAFCLRRDIESLGQGERDSVVEAFAAAAQTVQRACPALTEILSRATSGQDECKAIADWYGGLDLACPFLKDDVCMNYGRRPIACREHTVTSPPEHCRSRSEQAGQALPIAFSVLEALARLDAEVEDRPVESVMLPIALQWAGQNAARAERTFPGVWLAKRFANILVELSASSSVRAA
ncbi:MAG: hypothetical protein J7M14_08405 [Planctomycetes bacterium]|nr:hypothetical protein [Planctomycetota bacterium]